MFGRSRAGPTRALALLALANFFVGGMVGLERTVLPLLGQQSFGVSEGVAVSAFIASFGLAKALANLLAGALADRVGRKGVLLLGWLLGLPVPFMLLAAPSWGWVIAANLLLGANQALAWSMTVNMMVDVAPPGRHGLAAGLNEFAGYLGVSSLAFATGLLASHYGLGPQPFYLGVGVAVLGFLLALAVPETAPSGKPSPLGWVPGVGLPSLLGAATNLKDGLAWLALPLLMSARGSSLLEIGTVSGLYPLVWAAGQLVFGPLSDRWGRRGLVLAGLALQGAGLLVLAAAAGYPAALAAALLLGLGTGMVYPTLIAAVADRAPLEDRATALGIYRFFRDGGYVLGAALAGVALSWLGGMVAGVGVVLVLLAIPARRL